MSDSSSSKGRRKRPVVQPREIGPRKSIVDAGEKAPEEPIEATGTAPGDVAEEKEPAAPNRRRIAERKQSTDPGEGYRTLDALRQDQIESNTRRDRRSRRSTIPQPPAWDRDGPANTHSVRKLSPRARERRRVIAILAFLCFAPFAAFVFSMIVMTLWGSWFPPSTDPAEEVAPAPAIEAAAPAARDLKAVAEEAIGVATRFFAADSPTEQIKYVHDADRVLPLMKEYYQDHSIENDRPLRIGVKEAYLIEMIGRPEQFLVTSLERRDLTRREIVFVGSGDGGWKLDWEGLVGYSETNWTTFADRRPTEPERFRVIVTNDDYYNYEFKDHTRYTCFRLADQNNSLTLYGYVERGSPEEFDMQQALADRAYGLLILDLAFRDGAATGKQVEIANVVANSWLPGAALQIHAVTERMPLPD